MPYGRLYDICMHASWETVRKTDGEKGCCWIYVGWLRVCRAVCWYNIRWNKRTCGNLITNKDWQWQDEREGMRRTCLSALHSALTAHTHTHLCAHCGVFYFSQVLFSSLRESNSGQNCYSRVQPPLISCPNQTTLQNSFVICVVLVHVIITQNTFHGTWKRCLVLKKDLLTTVLISWAAAPDTLVVWIPQWPKIHK